MAGASVQVPQVEVQAASPSPASLAWEAHAKKVIKIGVGTLLVQCHVGDVILQTVPSGRLTVRPSWMNPTWWMWLQERDEKLYADAFRTALVGCLDPDARFGNALKSVWLEQIRKFYRDAEWAALCKEANNFALSRLSTCVLYQQGFMSSVRLVYMLAQTFNHPETKHKFPVQEADSLLELLNSSEHPPVVILGPLRGSSTVVAWY
jgi:hypothetical protein